MNAIYLLLMRWKTKMMSSNSSPKSDNAVLAHEHPLPQLEYLKKLLTDRQKNYLKFENDCIEYTSAKIAESIIARIETAALAAKNPYKCIRVKEYFENTWNDDLNKAILLSVFALLEPDFDVILESCKPICLFRRHDAIMTVSTKLPTQ
jgi:hypothetical protein